MGENVPMDNLRLEMNPESFYLLSYHHLEFGKFDSDKERDTPGPFVRRPSGATIEGRNLRELAVAHSKTGR